MLLRDMWWPHPAHGRINIENDGETLVFRCVCGETLGMPVFAAIDLGVLIDTSGMA